MERLTGENIKQSRPNSCQSLAPTAAQESIQYINSQCRSRPSHQIQQQKACGAQKVQHSKDAIEKDGPIERVDKGETV